MSPKHFDFGIKVVRRVSRAVNTARLRSLVIVTKSETEKPLEGERLKQEFLELAESQESLEKEGELKVLRQISAKVAEAKLHDVVTLVGRRRQKNEPHWDIEVGVKNGIFFQNGTDHNSIHQKTNQFIHLIFKKD